MSSIAKAQKEASNIQVFIRIRPFTDNQSQQLCCIDKINQKQITLLQKEVGEAPSFVFDGIFNFDSTQQQVYEEVTQNLIENAFQGINGTIFHYGQTSAGKSYTCVGKDVRDQKERGILPRTIQQILHRCQIAPKNIECKMTISTIEIYNQKIKDLLDPTKNDLKIRSDKSRGIFIEGVTEKYILSEEQANLYILKANQNRMIWHAHMGTHSTRSHVLYMITLHQHDVYTGEARAAKITIVDLAGSQKIMRTGVQGKILEQAKKINTSLSALGKVINILSEGKKTLHVPYRDSKLTRLLQQSLGGNSVTKLIINISPSIANQNETLTSLRFGSRAKIIKNQPRINKQFTVPQLLQLLGKHQKKIKILTDIIRQMMKQKDKPQMSMKQIAKMYLPNVDIVYQSNQSQQQAATRTLLKSVSSRLLIKKQSQQKSNIISHTKSFSGEFKFNRRDELTNHKSRQKFNPQIQKIGQIPKSKINSPKNHSLILLRSSQVLNQIFQPKIQFLSKLDNIVKNDIKINPQGFKQQQSDNQSVNINSQHKQNGVYPDYFHQISHRNYPETQSDKTNLINYHHPQTKSMFSPICSLNSKVLDISLSGFDCMTDVMRNKQIYMKADGKNKNYFSFNDNQESSIYQVNSIQFNIQKIRNNLRKLKNIRKSQII